MSETLEEIPDVSLPETSGAELGATGEDATIERPSCLDGAVARVFVG
jgi:hypothetical protein